MDRATAARVREWDDRPVAGGYEGLQELAEASFTGAVTNGTAWLFLLNGRIVGSEGGSVEAFDGVDSTAFRAPDPGLPLLYAMQAAGGEPRAKYYTDDNPLREVHETLAEAGFTGYVELSENVLSGDYYVVYYGGKSMSVAFVGNAERLVTGDEAFREAADEVGIYQVVDVELDVRNVPEPTEEAPAGAAAVATEPEGETAGSPEEPGPEPADTPATETSEPPAEEPDVPPTDDPEPEPTAAEAQGEAGAAPAAEPAADEPEPDPAEELEQPSASEPADPEAPTEGEDPFSEEAAWRETRTIPALDPEESEAPQPAEDGGRQAQPPEPAPEPEPEAEPAPEPQPTTEPDGADPEPSADDGGDDRIAELEAAIEAQNETIAELEARLESTSSEAHELREEREALAAELESARAGEGTAGGAPAGESLDPDDALDQTDLFVRYGSKGGGTLEKAHDGQIEREEVLNNLRIDHHTRFEEDEVSIAGRSFTEFLESSLEYRFVHWLVTQLLFEIQDTGSQRGLREVFDAIPRVDRVEFKGTVTWRDPEAGETHSEDFDVVCRDRMGQALVVANLNDVRDPATGEMMESLIEGSSTVAEGTETLGGAFLVTSSFFRPDALETASEATGGGLLSREKRWSYVKLARRSGYHLCLVEARGDDFHVAVPEL